MEDEPLSSAAITIFTVHGLPDRDSQPTDQLGPLRKALQIAPAKWRDHLWCPVTTRIGLGGVLLRLRDADFEFGAHRVMHDPPYDERDPEPFVPWFAREISTLPQGEPVVIIAYSAGAYIVYEWLATLATAQDVQRLSSIVCLAGPYWFAQPEQDLVFAHNPALGVTVREKPPLDPAAIARFLRPGQLLTLLAGNDATILPDYASFRGTEAEPLINEEEVPDAEHHTVCGHQRTVAIIRSRLLPLAGFTPPESEGAVKLG